MPKDGRRIGKKVYYFDEAKLARADIESGASTYRMGFVPYFGAV